MKLSHWVSALTLATLGLTACGQDVASSAKLAATGDKGVIERNEALDVMAKAICERHDELGEVGSTDAKYVNLDECKAKERDRWADTWTEEKCGGHHGAYAGKVRECRDRAQTWESSGNLLDFGGLFTECSARAVCRQ